MAELQARLELETEKALGISTKFVTLQRQLTKEEKINEVISVSQNDEERPWVSEYTRESQTLQKDDLISRLQTEVSDLKKKV